MNKFVALLAKEKRLRMNGKIISAFRRALHNACKKLGQFFFGTYSLTCLKRKTSAVLFEVINI